MDARHGQRRPRRRTLRNLLQIPVPLNGSRQNHISFHGACAADRGALHGRPPDRLGRRGARRHLGGTHGRRLRPRHTGHHPADTAAQSRHGTSGRRGARRQRPADADPFPQPAGRALCAGHQLGRRAGRSAVPAGGSPAGRLGALVRAVARHRRRGMARRGTRAAGRDGGQPPHQGHHGHPHPGHDVRLGHQFRSRDTPIPVERGGAQIVRHLDDGVAGRRHGRQPRPDAPGHRRGARAQHRRHQAAQPAAAGRKLCPHDGAQRATHPYAAVPLHRTAGRYRHRLLRPRGLHRAGRPAPGTHALRQCRPPHPHAGVDARGRRPAAGLRPHFENPGAADQHRHGPDGHPGGHHRRRPQPQPLLKWQPPPSIPPDRTPIPHPGHRASRCTASPSPTAAASCCATPTPCSRKGRSRRS